MPELSLELIEKNHKKLLADMSAHRFALEKKSPHHFETDEQTLAKVPLLACDIGFLLQRIANQEVIILNLVENIENLIESLEDLKEQLS